MLNMEVGCKMLFAMSGEAIANGRLGTLVLGDVVGYGGE